MRVLLFIITLTFWGANGQSSDRAIYATSSKNVSLFFHSPINTAIVGSNNFVFGFNKEDKSTYGLLKAFPGMESNLLVTTEDGNIYSFIVKYKKEISTLSHFIDDSLAIGNIKGNKMVKTKNTISEDSIRPEAIANLEATSKISKTITINDFEYEGTDVTRYSKQSDGLYEQNKDSYYGSFSKNEIEKDRYFVRFNNSSSKVFLKLKNITYNRDELYFTLIIDNKSNLDYDVEDLSFYIVAKNKSRKTSTQRIPYEPIYVYEAPNRIGANEIKEAVFVFKKFSINSQKVLMISLSELKGERNINLEVPNSNINNPNLN